MSPGDRRRDRARASNAPPSVMEAPRSKGPMLTSEPSAGNSTTSPRIGSSTGSSRGFWSSLVVMAGLSDIIRPARPPRQRAARICRPAGRGERRWPYSWIRIAAEERMTKGIGCVVAVVVVVALIALAMAGTYNRLVGLSQAVDAQWAQVESVYQRRADLIPNLVATVQGAANFERETLEAVTRARAGVAQTQAPANI